MLSRRRAFTPNPPVQEGLADLASISSLLDDDMLVQMFERLNPNDQRTFFGLAHWTDRLRLLLNGRLAEAN